MNFRSIGLSQVHADEPESQAEPEPDLVDPQDELREQCGKKREMSKLYNLLQECNERVNSRTNTQETCEQELFDYVQAVDNCVAKKLFSQLI